MRLQTLGIFRKSIRSIRWGTVAGIWAHTWFFQMILRKSSETHFWFSIDLAWSGCQSDTHIHAHPWMCVGEMTPNRPVTGMRSRNDWVCIGFRTLAWHEQNDTTVPTVLIGLSWPIVIRTSMDVRGCASGCAFGFRSVNHPYVAETIPAAQDYRIECYRMDV